MHHFCFVSHAEEPLFTMSSLFKPFSLHTYWNTVKSEALPASWNMTTQCNLYDKEAADQRVIQQGQQWL